MNEPIILSLGIQGTTCRTLINLILTKYGREYENSSTTFMILFCILMVLQTRNLML